MPRVLVVKTSSLGDAARVIPDMVFDWGVEQSFSKAPGWRPSVDQAITVSAWRCHKYPICAWWLGEWTQFKEQAGYFNTSFTGVVK